MSVPTSTPDHSLLVHAQHLVALGFAVFPLYEAVAPGRCACGRACSSPGKHPRVANGVKDASRDPNQIQLWWTKWPTASIGIATGATSNLVVVDVDGPGGETSLAGLVTRHGPLPPTWSVATGKGRHLYFRIPGGAPAIRNSAGGVGVGIDVRGDGGYVVAPPSIHANWVRYTWVGDAGATAIAELPSWLLDRVKERAAAPPCSSGTYRSGQRNAELTSHAGKLRRNGADESTIAAALAALNKTVCDPPLDDTEVRAIAASVARYEPHAVPLRVAATPPPIVVTNLATVKVARVDWLWRAWLPRGAVTVLEGDPGLGKSTIAIDIAARLTRGAPMPDGEARSEPMNVLFLTTEDSFPETVLPRLLAAEGDPARMSFFEIPERDQTRPPRVPEDIAAFRRAIDEVQAGFVVMDPFVGHLDEGVNANNDQDVRRALGAVGRLARETQTTFLLLRHLNKNSSAPAMYRGGGSIGISAAARSVWIAARDPDDENGCILAPQKSNLARPPRSRRFRIEDVPHIGSSRARWGEECDLRSEDLVRGAATDDERSALDEAKEFIQGALTAGPVAITKLADEARKVGISMPTFKRARRALGVKPVKETGVLRGHWYLPGQQTELPVMETPEGDQGQSDPLRADHEGDQTADVDPLRKRKPS